jgi:hypothetical protein
MGGASDRYGYCLNDPVNGRDPEGLLDEEIQREAYDLRTLPGIGETMLANDFALKVDEWQKKLREDDDIELDFSEGFRTTKAQEALNNNPNAITPRSGFTSLSSSPVERRRQFETVV